MKNIAGTYKVIKYGYLYKKDNSFKPISDWFSGVIHYSDTGYMNVIMRFKEKPESFSDIVAYSGSYVVEGNKIIHNVTMSARPEYENEILEREFKLIGPGELAGSAQTSDLELDLELEFENTPEFRKFAIWQRI